jgi:DegV family protein with EDD domain
MGLGLQVMRAARTVAAGHSLDDVKRVLGEARRKAHVYAVLDTLEFLRRSGRVSWPQFGLGALLSIKPIVSFHVGQVDLERVRTARRARARLLSIFRSLQPVADLAVLHTGAPEAAAALREELGVQDGDGQLPPIVGVTPTIGAHIGPGAVGFACLEAG